jgi:hypothetical protein
LICKHVARNYWITEEYGFDIRESRAAINCPVYNLASRNEMKEAKAKGLDVPSLRVLMFFFLRIFQYNIVGVFFCKID